MKKMRSLCGALEQLISSLRKGYGDFTFQSMEIPLVIIQESETPEAIKLKISKTVCEKLEADVSYSVGLYYVGATSRLLTMCGGTCKRNELCKWVDEKMDKPVASFAIIVKNGKHTNSGLKAFLFTC